MKSVFLENKGHYHTRVNGNVIDQAKWNVDYDGKTANLEAEKNGETVYMKLTNDDYYETYEYRCVTTFN